MRAERVTHHGRTDQRTGTESTDAGAHRNGAEGASTDAGAAGRADSAGIAGRWRTRQGWADAWAYAQGSGTAVTARGATVSDLDDILRARLGPDPLEMLRTVMAEHPAMTAAVLVLELPDGQITAFSGGCTMIETLGMLSFAASAAVHGMKQQD